MKNFYKIKKACPPMRRGISIIEILIVIAVLGIIFAIVLPQFSKMRENQVLKNGVGDVLSAIDKARAQTLSSLNSFSYGVHFEAGKVIIFKDESFISIDANNETINIIAPASISNVYLDGVSTVSGEFYFNRLSGTPSKTGSVTLSTPNYSKIIRISSTGVASVD